MKNQNQKQQPAVTPQEVDEQEREFRAILYTLATTDASRVNPFRDDWEPECPYCTGTMEMEQPIDVFNSSGVTPDGDVSLDGIRHAPRCIVLRARMLVGLLSREAGVRVREGA